MKRLVRACIATVGLMCLGAPAFATGTPAGSICTLPPATDSFSSSEGWGIIPTPVGPLPFAVCGPTTIVRGAPVSSGTSCTIPTEIVSMTLTGLFDPCGLNTPIRIIEDPGIMSTGAIVTPDGDLPASSFFDVFTLVDIPGLGILGMPHYVKVFANSVKLATDSLNHLPPGATTPGGPGCVEPGDDYYAAGFGAPGHEHIPCPPKELGCCLLPCGRLLKVSERTCQHLHGQITQGQGCLELCRDQPSPALRRSWGTVKSYYR